MGLFSLAKLFGITLRESANDGSDFTNPDADYRRLFLGEDGLLHVKDSAGAVTSPYTGGSATHTFKRTVAIGTGNMTTTSTSKVAIDTTDLAYLTLDLAIGDVVRCTLAGQAFMLDATNAVGFDFEVDRPTSADTFIGSAAEFGLTEFGGNDDRQVVFVEGLFTATEAGVHGFRPAWLVTGGTATLSNASSGQ